MAQVGYMKAGVLFLLLLYLLIRNIQVVSKSHCILGLLPRYHIKAVLESTD